jgi:hypothetical protein
VLRAGALAIAAFLPLPAPADAFTLSAHPGYYNAKTLGSVASKATVSGSLRIVQFNGGNGWPPGAYVGFHQGPDRDQSVQFVVIRNKESDPYVVAGYRVIEGGKEAKVASLANLPVDSVVRFALVFDKGVVTLQMNDQSPVTVRVPFTEAASYVSVSSGTAEFKVDP